MATRTIPPTTTTNVAIATSGMEKLKMAKEVFTVGTWNVRTLWAAAKLELLRNEMKRYKYDVIGVSEVRWTGIGETSNGDFIWFGENSTHTRGVGMLMNTKAKKTLLGYNPINSRIITARFQATPFNVTVTHAYASTSASSEDEIETFYDGLERAIAPTPKKDVFILTEDCNAKVGCDNAGWEEVMGKYGYGTRNERGERLLEFVAGHNLFISNTRFQQKPNRKWTWESVNGIHKNMIDLIIIEKRWKTSIINCRTFQGADISSDHSLVLCNIKLWLKQLRNKPRANHRIEVSRLKEPVNRQLYQARLKDSLQRIDTSCNLNEHAAQIEKAVKEAVRTTVTAKRTAKKPWIFEQTLALADKKREAKEAKQLSRDHTTRYKELCNMVKKSAKRDKEEWIKGKCNDIEKGLQVGNHRQAYSLMKILTKKHKPKLTVVKDQGGTLLQSKEDICQSWTKYCRSLYDEKGGGDNMVRGLESITPPWEGNSNEILYAEVEAAMCKLKPNKSTGTDEITVEILQAGGEHLTRRIQELCNRAWKEETIPEEWGSSIGVFVKHEMTHNDPRNGNGLGG